MAMTTANSPESSRLTNETMAAWRTIMLRNSKARGAMPRLVMKKPMKNTLDRLTSRWSP